MHFFVECFLLSACLVTRDYLTEMHRSSDSWTTTVRDSGGNGASFLFQTAPMGDCSVDGNNNEAEKIGVVGDGPHPPDHLATTCDDCGRKRTGGVLRWCESCSSAICDACILDRHLDGHIIVWYQEALRGANAQYAAAIRKGTHELSQLNEENRRARRVHRQIVTTLDEVKKAVCRREKEIRRRADILRDGWKEAAKLCGPSLNASTAQARRHVGDSLKAMAVSLLDLQVAECDQLKEIERVVARMILNVVHSRSDQQ